jgi:integrase
MKNFTESPRATSDLLSFWQNSLNIAQVSRGYYQRHVKKFILDNKIFEPNAITAELIQNYIGRLACECAPRTVQLKYFALRSFCNFLNDYSYLLDNPCDKVKLPKIEKSFIRYLSPAEITQVLALAARHNLYHHIKFALYTGQRRFELQHMHWDRVHLHRRILEVKGKGKKLRTIPLAAEILEDMKALYAPGQLVFPNRRGRLHCLDWWEKALKPIRMVMPQITGWHIFRHTFASQLAQRGVSIAKISAWLGHSNIQITLDYYANLAPEMYDEDINALSQIK